MVRAFANRSLLLGTSFPRGLQLTLTSAPDRNTRWSPFLLPHRAERLLARRSPRSLSARLDVPRSATEIFLFARDHGRRFAVSGDEHRARVQARVRGAGARVLHARRRDGRRGQPEGASGQAGVDGTRLGPRPRSIASRLLVAAGARARRARARRVHAQRGVSARDGGQARGHRGARPRRARARDGGAAPARSALRRRGEPRARRGRLRPAPTGAGVAHHRRPDRAGRPARLPGARGRGRRRQRPVPGRVRGRHRARRRGAPRRALGARRAAGAGRARSDFGGVGRPRGGHGLRGRARDGRAGGGVRGEPGRARGFAAAGCAARPVLPPRAGAARAGDGGGGVAGEAARREAGHGAARVPGRRGRRVRHAVRQGLRARRGGAQGARAGHAGRAGDLRAARGGRQGQGAPAGGALRLGLLPRRRRRRPRAANGRRRRERGGARRRR